MRNVKREALHRQTIGAVLCVSLALISRAFAQDSVDSILADIKAEAPGDAQGSHVSRDDLRTKGGVWLFPDSSIRKLGDEELSSMGKEQLWRARNEIFARRGFIFATDKGKRFSESLGAAYQPLSADVEEILASMNPIERYNIRIIESVEKAGMTSGAQWVIATEAVGSKADAVAAARRWADRGFPSDVLWIPDYSSLSGARLWLVYIGPWSYRDRDAPKSLLGRVKRFYPDAYAIKVDNSGVRERLD